MSLRLMWRSGERNSPRERLHGERRATTLVATVAPQIVPDPAQHAVVVHAAVLKEATVFDLM